MVVTPTPMMAQYLDVKAAHTDCLLLYRMGDFYELFFEDAEVAAATLNIALTKRGQHGGDPIPMCGVPHHSVDQYMSKLIAAGHRVALCEQTEDPAAAKKRGSKAVVRREVVRILTPGTLTEDAFLDQGRSAYLAALASLGGAQRGEVALAWIDLSTGHMQVQALPHPCRAADLEAALVQLDPGEVLAADTLLGDHPYGPVLDNLKNRLTPQPAQRFSSTAGAARLKSLYGLADLSPFGDLSRAEVAAAGALVDYIDLTQKAAKPLIKPLKQVRGDGQLYIDAATRRNLELTQTLAGRRAGSLLATIDRTLTGAGARLLADRLSRPSAQQQDIERRQASLSYLIQAPRLLEDIRGYLKLQPDLARAVQRLCLGRGGPRDMLSLANALASAGQIRTLLGAAQARLPFDAELRQAWQDLGDFDALGHTLVQALKDEVPVQARDGGFVRPGFRADLDTQVELRDASRKLIAQMQADLVAKTAIASLKIKHNNVLGYFIEVTAVNADKMPSDPEAGFIHRQTLASATRYTTVELSELEEKIRAAAEKSLALELEVYENLRCDIVAVAEGLLTLADALATLDLSCALAHLAMGENWVKPIINETRELRVTAGRHPVVEAALRKDPQQAFMANDLSQNTQDHIWLLTGPNMAGKSTYLRQNALIMILAQMGSYVPAQAAEIGLVDRLFSRVGASDDLASGRSTFMVEMVETATILNQATARSFVILDEIGRGTATYDGLSIAWATVEYLATQIQCRALFATHYHELTALADRLDALSCHSCQVKEWQGEVVFLHTVAPGAADRSYGIHVGKLAGLPPAVVKRAEAVLTHLEADKNQSTTLGQDLPLFNAQPMQATRPAPCPALDLLATLDVDQLSPREALAKLYELKDLSHDDP